MKKTVFSIAFLVLISSVQIAFAESIPGFCIKAPVIIDQSDDQTADEGSFAYFWVEAEEISDDYKTIFKWYFEPKNFGEGQRYALKDGNGISGSDTANLKVTASFSTEGVYICYVNNRFMSSVGIVDSDTTVVDPMVLNVINKKPIQPVKPNANVPGKPNPRIIASQDSISVDWLQIDEGGSPVLAYYCQINDEEPHMIFFTPYGANITYFRGLTPGTEYSLKLWAENAVGKGPSYTETKSTTGKKPDPSPEYPFNEGYEKYTLMDTLIDVSLDKFWTIKYNRPFVENDIKYIKILDSGKKELESKVTHLKSDRKSLIYPEDNYKGNSWYIVLVELMNGKKYKLEFLTIK